MKKVLCLLIVLGAVSVQAGTWAGSGLCSVYAGNDHQIPNDELSKIISGWYQFIVATTGIFYDKISCEADLALQCKSKGETFERSWKIINYRPEQFISPQIGPNARCYFHDDHEFDPSGEPVDLPDGVDSPLKDILRDWNPSQNFRNLPDLDSVYTPRSPSIPVPSLDWVMDYIKEHWDEFTLGLILAILGAVTVYIGGNAFLAFITGGTSLPSLGATAPILAAVLVAILMKHGAINSVPRGVPTASVESLMIEVDPNSNTFTIEGEVNGQVIEKQVLSLSNLQNLYHQIQVKREINQNQYTGSKPGK